MQRFIYIYMIYLKYSYTPLIRTNHLIFIYHCLSGYSMKKVLFTCGSLLYNRLNRVGLENKRENNAQPTHYFIQIPIQK